MIWPKALEPPIYCNARIISYTMARTSYIQWHDDDVRFVLDQHVLKLYLNCASSLKQQSEGRHIAGHSETLHWFRVDQILRLLIKDAANTNFYSYWCDPTGARTHDLPHSSRARKPLHHRCCYFFIRRPLYIKVICQWNIIK